MLLLRLVMGTAAFVCDFDGDDTPPILITNILSLEEGSNDGQGQQKERRAVSCDGI